MSLLDDVSIVITPNGYKAGTLFGAIPVPTFGSDVVVNGGFTADTDWSKGGNWSIGSGVATANGNSNGNISQNIPLTSGTTYSITYTVVNASSGSQIGLAPNGSTIQNTRTADGTYNEIYTATNTTLYIRSLWNNGNPVSVDNVSVKEWLGADMDVTRATAATRVDENGLVADVLSNVPRIDYTGGGCPHILAEPQRTNLIPYSEDLTQWNKGNLTISSDAIVSPDGTQNADTLNVIDDNDFIYEGATTTASTEYVFTFYVKRGTIAESSLKLAIYDDTNNAFIVSDISYSASDSEWTRVTQSFTTPVGCILIRAYAFRNSSTTLGTFSVWGAQLEEGSYATSYIPNFGTALGVTRNQDQFSRDGISSLINSEEGVLFVEMAKFQDATNFGGFELNDGTSSNSVSVYTRNASSSVTVIIRKSGTQEWRLDYNTGVNTYDFNSYAIRFSDNNFSLWVNGSKAGEQLSGSTPLSLSNLTLSAFWGGTFYGKVKQLQVFKTALTDSELIALTS